MALIDTLLEDGQEPFDDNKPYSWTFAGATANQKKTPANDQELAMVLGTLNPAEYDGITIFKSGRMFKGKLEPSFVLIGKLSSGKRVYMAAKSFHKAPANGGHWATSATEAVRWAINDL